MRSLLLAVCLVLALHCGEAALFCNSRVVAELYHCRSYLEQGGRDAPATCCNGIKTLKSQAKTPKDRRHVCRCIKSSISGISSKNNNNGLSLPAKCGVNLPYSISPSTNCDRIN